MKFAAMGDNCMDVYPDSGLSYPTGNAVDTAVNMRKFGVETSLISVTGNDENGRRMMEALHHENIDLSHFHVADGPTAVTYMRLDEKDRVHVRYDEGVLKDLHFTSDDVAFAASHDLVHTALWGKAELVLPDMKRLGAKVSFDYADKLNDPLVWSTLGYVDYGFYSYHGKADYYIRDFLSEKVAMGMKIATATLGSNGSVACDCNGFRYFGVIPAKVVNTVGAGDSYIAGFLFALMKGCSISECMKSGARAASRVISVFKPWVG